MKIITINSPKYGIHEVFVDDDDYPHISKMTWCINKDKSLFYAVSASKSPRVRMHRLILNLGSGHSDKRLVDHIDGNPCNNQKINLRIVTVNENGYNVGKRRKNSTSKYKGVYWNKAAQLWKSAIVKDKKFIHLGYYKSEFEGAVAYNKAAKKLHGKFAFYNNINGWETIEVHKVKKEQSSKHRGVYYNNKRRQWVAYLNHCGKYYSKGFLLEIDAATYYNQLVIKIIGPHSKINTV